MVDNKGGISMLIKIASQFSDKPGGRFISKGEYSGELFREQLLSPNYLIAKEKREILTVDFDGGYGYGTSFLEESFGGLVRKLQDPEIPKYLNFISEEQPSVINKVNDYISDAIKELN